MGTPTGTAERNDIAPQARLADVPRRIAGTLQNRIEAPLPGNRGPEQRLDQAA